MTRRSVLKAMLAAAGAAGTTDLLAQSAGTPGGLPKGYRLVWQDDFNADGRPNPKNWTYEHGFVRNEEFQWYQPENATCSEGKLIIESRREKKLNPNYRKGSKELALQPPRRAIHFVKPDHARPPQLEIWLFCHARPH